MKPSNKRVKTFLNACAKAIPFSLLQKSFANELVVVNYHDLRQGVKTVRAGQRTYRTTEQFEQDIIFFKQRFKVVGLHDLLEVLNGKKKWPHKALLITIDDGLKVVYDQMFPILKKHGVTALVFINPAFVDNKDMHYRRKAALLSGHINERLQKSSEEVVQKLTKYGFSSANYDTELSELSYEKSRILDGLCVDLQLDIKNVLKREPAYLTNAEIRELVEADFGIGGHSMDHPPLTELRSDEQVKQLVDSVDWVQKKYNLYYRLLAYPSNDAPLSLSVLKQVSDKVDVSFGVQGFKKDMIDRHWHRIEIESEDSSPKQALKVAFLKGLGFRFLKKNKVERAE